MINNFKALTLSLVIAACFMVPSGTMANENKEESCPVSIVVDLDKVSLKNVDNKLLLTGANALLSALGPQICLSFKNASLFQRVIIKNYIDVESTMKTQGI